jgi:hypothetical protein
MATGWLDEALATCGRYRLVDSVEREEPERLVVSWTAKPDLSVYRTDGADRVLLLPGTVALEHAVQGGEALIWRRRGRPAEDGVPVLARMRSVKCRDMIRPGQTLVTELAWQGQTGPAFEVRAVSRVDGRKVLEADLVFTAAPVPGYPTPP